MLSISQAVLVALASGKHCSKSKNTIKSKKKKLFTRSTDRFSPLTTMKNQSVHFAVECEVHSATKRAEKTLG